MIRHVVLLRFAPAVEAGEKTAIFAELAALREVVPGFLAFAAGSNVSPEGMSKGFTHAFTVDFATAVDRDAYLAHPAHQAAGARLVRAVDGGLDGLLVLDFETEPQRG